MEPDLSLLKPKRFGLVPSLVVLLLVVGGAYLVFLPGVPIPKPAPPPKPTAQAPLLVTLAPTPEATSGWCCIERTLVETTRAACTDAKGTFAITKAAAPAACRPASPAVPATTTSGSPKGPGTGG
jgi:hypothetical protein